MILIAQKPIQPITRDHLCHGTPSEAESGCHPILTPALHRFQEQETSNPNDPHMTIMHVQTNHYTIGKNMLFEEGLGTETFMRCMNTEEVAPDGSCCFVAFLRQLEVCQ